MFILVLAASLYALTMLDLPFVFGTGPFWKAPYGDRFTNLIGALYYVRDAWRFPIFYVPSLGFPEGANIVYTDSLPLLALVFKAIYKLSGVWFNYFGLWIFACFPLLAVFTALAAREAGLKDKLGLIAAGILGIASPAFLFRFMHIALMGHFLIVWGIYLYLRLRNDPLSVSAVIQFAIASSMAVMLQAYFLMMVLPFFGVALAQSLVEKRLNLRRAATALLVVLGVLVATGFVTGVIGPNSPRATAGGFGFWSMNVLSPLVPPREHLPEFLSHFVTWDSRGLTWEPSGAQYEGYNYLGAGLLLLIVMHLVASPRLGFAMIARHGFLALMLLGYFLVAISNRMFIGNWVAVDFQLPHYLDVLTSYFRTGGRFFWPAYYVFMIGLLVLTYQRFGRRTAQVLTTVVVVLQLVDTQPLRAYLAADAARGYPQNLPLPAWQPLLTAHRFFKQFPSFQCGGWAATWADNNENMELLWQVAKLDMPTNSVYLGRNNRDCARERAEGLKFDIQPDGLYVFAGDFPIVMIGELPQFRTWCREFSHGVVCSRKWDTASKLDSSTFKPITGARYLPKPDSYKLGETLTFSTNGTGERFLLYGWSSPELWGTWSTGGRSELVLGIPEVTTDLILTVHALASVHTRNPVKDVEVFINGKPMADWTFRMAEVPTERSVIIPKDLLHGAHSVRVGFAPSLPESKRDIGLSADSTPIGLGLIDLTLSEAKQGAN